MAITLSVVTPSPLVTPTAYRAAVTAADSATINALAFTTTQQSAAPTVTGAIPVLPATGFPNAFVAARLANSTDTVGVTPVAINIVQGSGATPVVTVLGFGLETTLGSCSPVALTGGAGIFYTPASISSTYGSKSGAPLGGGTVTHVAWIVTTAPTSSHSVDLYAWMSG